MQLLHAGRNKLSDESSVLRKWFWEVRGLGKIEIVSLPPTRFRTIKASDYVIWSLSATIVTHSGVQQEDFEFICAPTSPRERKYLAEDDDSQKRHKQFHSHLWHSLDGTNRPLA